jgi:hypothetical protein
MSDDLKSAGGAPPRPATAPDLRIEIAEAVERIAALIEPWRDGKVLRQRIHAELTKLAALRARPVHEGADRT